MFQQDGASAHVVCSAQNMLRANCPDFTTKDQWPENSVNINPMDYFVWGAMLEAYHKLKTSNLSKAHVTCNSSGPTILAISVQHAIK